MENVLPLQGGDEDDMVSDGSDDSDNSGSDMSDKGSEAEEA